MDITTLIQLFPALAPYAVYIAAAVGLAAQVAALMPPPVANGSVSYSRFYTLVNWVGRNVRYAANASAPPKKGA